MAPKHNSVISVAATAHSDLIPNVYEGGLKTWECSIDLANFVAESLGDIKGKRILELGCGSALPGICAMLKGAQVDFQDYNKEVILDITVPNILLNATFKGVPPAPAAEDTGTSFLKVTPATFSRLPCKLFVGDWGSLSEVIGAKYDIILTSETIYSPASYTKLVEALLSLLDRPHGVCYIAAKRYYFGVGGGIHSFTERLLQTGVLTVTPVFSLEEGVPREILKVTFRQ